MRVAVVIPGLWLIALVACVPEFAYRDGSEGDGGDGGASTTGRGGGGEGDRPVVAVGVTGSASVGAGPGPGPGSGPGPGDTTATTADTGPGATTGGGGDGSGGADTGDATTAAAATSTGSGTPVDDGIPCWDADLDQATACDGGDVCCYDPGYDECAPRGGCHFYAYELECNDSTDCGEGESCCVNVDPGGYLDSIRCDSRCDDLQACSAVEGCPEGLTCYYVFDPDVDEAPYDAYGYCG